MAFFGVSSSISLNSTPENFPSNQDSIDSCSDGPLLSLGLACSNIPTAIPLGENDHSSTFTPGQFGFNKRVTKFKKKYVTAYRSGAHNHMNLLNQNSLFEGIVVTEKMEKTTEYFFPSPSNSSHHRHLILPYASHHPQTSSAHDYNVPHDHHIQAHQLTYPTSSMNPSNTMNHPFSFKDLPHSEFHHTHPNHQSKPHGKDVVVDDDDDVVAPRVSGDVNFTSKTNRVENFADRYVGEDYRSNTGRTHSLPHPKYGPYTCPRCNEVYQTSQIFAAHTRTHYKDESKEERDERLAARNRKNCFVFVGSSSRAGPATKWPVGQYRVKNEDAIHLPPVITTISGKDWRNMQSKEEGTSGYPYDLEP